MSSPGASLPAGLPPAIGCLETPACHELRPSGAQRFAGFALRLGGTPFTTLEVWAGERLLAEPPASLPSPDVGGHLPQLPGSASCRFAFDLEISSHLPDLELRGRPAAGASVPLWTYPLTEIGRYAASLEHHRRRLAAVPEPDPELVFATQGGRDVASYTRSIPPALWLIQSYLDAAGVGMREIGSLLDFGCGTGRLLVSWWLDERRRALHGCDIHPDLVAWCQAHLPPPIAVRHSRLDPPLPYPEGSFDLVQAVSVLTHLSLERQRRWLAELARVLVPGGTLLLTLHGPLYVHLLTDAAAQRRFADTGYLEGAGAAEGANAFATFHHPRFAAGLFAGFRPLAFFPRGEIDGRPPLSPLALFQDVYLLRRL